MKNHRSIGVLLAYCLNSCELHFHPALDYTLYSWFVFDALGELLPVSRVKLHEPCGRSSEQPVTELQPARIILAKHLARYPTMDTTGTGTLTDCGASQSAEASSDYRTNPWRDE